ncbi:Endonuclease V [Dyadobacter koreensis]|uniref:Endonuclease V n=1 Tax=Dyadobacter koreensis TaxID=408657 RepID=A0A1H6ZPU1_9BACT|nr:deoxyribonuclease V [Dyadobacter koreensis]SEJ53577.1 Endonuclease V [Dyadobacter koreensis]
MEEDDLKYDELNLAEAKAIQNELRERTRIEPLQNEITTIAGADISLNRFSEVIFAGIVMLRYSDMQPIAYSMVESRTSFPYVPGFLAFREVPALVQALEQMSVKPDVIMVDGHGIAHPRRMGIAAHFGALTGMATMGCAKNILFGKWQEPGIQKGEFSPIMTKEEIIGYAFRSKLKTNPVFVSPGNKLSLQNSLDIMQRCSGSYRLPEPTRRAHDFVNLFRTGKLESGYHELNPTLLF